MKYDLKIIGSINESTVKDFLYCVEYKNWKEDPTFSIYIHSQGGHVESSVAIYDYIKTNKIPTVVHCGGQCESAANIILAAGGHKCAYKNTIFMFHEMNPEDRSKIKKVRGKLEHLTKFYNSIYPNIDWNNEKLLYLNAREAYIAKIIDEIL